MDGYRWVEQPSRRAALIALPVALTLSGFLRQDNAVLARGRHVSRYGTLNALFHSIGVPMSFTRCSRLQPWLLCFFLGLAGPVIALDLNQATRSQLRAIKGVGDKLADRILSAREQGRFVSMEDFAARVPGVGAKKLQKLREQGVIAGALSPNLANSPTNPDAAVGPRGRHSLDTERAMPAGRGAAVTYGAAGSPKSSADTQAARPLPAMPMLIRPRPRTTDQTVVSETESSTAGQQRKTH